MRPFSSAPGPFACRAPAPMPAPRSPISRPNGSVNAAATLSRSAISRVPEAPVYDAVAGRVNEGRGVRECDGRARGAVPGSNGWTAMHRSMRSPVRFTSRVRSALVAQVMPAVLFDQFLAAARIILGRRHIANLQRRFAPEDFVGPFLRLCRAGVIARRSRRSRSAPAPAPDRLPPPEGVRRTRARFERRDERPAMHPAPPPATPGARRRTDTLPPPPAGRLLALVSCNGRLPTDPFTGGSAAFRRRDRQRHWRDGELTGSALTGDRGESLIRRLHRGPYRHGSERLRP